MKGAKNILALRAVLLFLLFANCAGSGYRFNKHFADDQINLGTKKGYHHPLRSQGHGEVFLWGLFKDHQGVSLENLLQLSQHRRLANVSVAHFQSGLDIFWSIASLGMYIPFHYELKGFEMTKDEGQ